MWANINSFRATVKRVSRGGLAVDLEDGTSLAIEVDGRTNVIRSDGTEASGSTEGVRAGEVLQVIASGSPASDLLGTRLISLSGPHNPSASEARRHGRGIRARAAFTAEHSGNTTWFCCGGVDGCGAGCGSSGCGACCSSYPCRSDLNAIAWPKLTSGCGPYNGNCSLDSSFPSHSCGVCMDIQNPCIGTIVRVRIRDCGPTVHCVGSTGCMGYSQVKFDLTPCAFTAIGGSLSAGVQNLQTSAVFTC